MWYDPVYISSCETTGIHFGGIQSLSLQRSNQQSWCDDHGEVHGACMHCARLSSCTATIAAFFLIFILVPVRAYQVQGTAQP